jgi:hypothetical protein
MIGLVLFALFLLIFAILAGRFGVDSREDSTDPRRSPYPVGID